MKKIVLTLTLLILSISLFGCRSKAPSQSTFKADFSLNSLVEANKEYLLEDTRVSSGAEVGPREPFVQNHEELIVQIDPADVSQFLQEMRSEVSMSLANHGASVLGQEVNGNKDVGFFSYSYSENDVYGTITLWGVRGEGTNFFLIAIITES